MSGRNAAATSSASSAVMRSLDLVAHELEHHRQAHRRVPVVVNDQNAASAVRGRARRYSSLPLVDAACRQRPEAG